MKAKVLILPDANASFVSYMKRQRALCKYHAANQSSKFTVTLADVAQSSAEQSDSPMGIPSPSHPVSSEQSDPRVEPSK